MLGSVGFNWQLGSLATSRGQGGVGRAGRLVGWKQGGVIIFFLTSGSQKKIDLSDLLAA